VAVACSPQENFRSQPIAVNRSESNLSYTMLSEFVERSPLGKAAASLLAAAGNTTRGFEFLPSPPISVGSPDGPRLQDLRYLAASQMKPGSGRPACMEERTMHS